MAAEAKAALRPLLRILHRLPTISAVGLASVLAAAALLQLTYNSTPSLPVGVYQLRPLRGEPRRGDVVGFCLEGRIAGLALARGYVHPEGLERFVFGVRCTSGAAAIGKPVAGVPGDTVDVRRTAVWINGVRLGRSEVRPRDGAGRPLPHAAWGRRTLGREEYWLHSAHSERSFDSRYYGPVQRRQIRDRRQPVWTGGHGRAVAETSPSSPRSSARSVLGY